MQLDVKAVQSAIVAGLPLRARWTIKETPLDYDFSVARGGLHPLPKETFHSAENVWFELLIFGECDYAEGGGAQSFLGIRTIDGAVYGLDVEREGDAIFLFNSCIERFIQTFSFFNEHLGLGKQLPLDVESPVRAIDPQVYPASDWKSLVDYLAD